MRRPLAVFGFATLGWLLVLPQLGPAGLAISGVVLAALLLVCLGLRRAAKPRRWARVLPALVAVLAAGVLAVTLRGVHGAALARPVAALAGTEAEAEVRVLEAEPGYGEDTVHATVRVLNLEGEDAPSNFKLKLRGLPEATLGQTLALRLRFYDFGTSGARAQSYGKGFYVGASAVGAPRVTGLSHTFLTRVRQLQYAASENIRARLPLRLGSVAAAMTVGDRRYIPYEITEAYRAAGVSHMLVVSGLHLSLLCGFVLGLLKALLRRPGAAAVGTMAFVALFAVLAGLTPSVVRSALVWLLVLAAPLASRRADTLTSLGAAALALMVANPYAATDVGLLLSFTATLGAMASGDVWKALAKRLPRKMRPAPDTPAAKAMAWPGKAARRLGRAASEAACTSLCVTLATLPVLVYAGMSLSLLSLPMNVLMVPFLPWVVLCGFTMALPAVPVLGWPGMVGAVVSGAILNVFQRLAEWCASIPGAMVPLGGMFGLVVVGAVYLLAFAGYKTRRPLACGLAALVLLAGAGGLHAWLNAGTVSVTVAGSGANSSLVVCSGDEAVVLYRSRLSAGAVQRVLRQSGASCELLIDLRRTAETTEYETLFRPAQVVLAQDDLLAGAGYEPFENVTVQVARQGGGTAACVDVAGYKVGLCTGGVNLSAYAPLDVLVAGSGKVQGSYAILLAGASVPDWADPDAAVYHTDGDVRLWLRPGKSAILREVRDDADG